ncbi:MAG: hypothetical protein ABSA46_17860 [Thermodesulfovibrionales bacterium]|jgi:hypothetical protein
MEKCAHKAEILTWRPRELLPYLDATAKNWEKMLELCTPSEKKPVYKQTLFKPIAVQDILKLHGESA